MRKELFVGGGRLATKYLPDFVRLSVNGVVLTLSPMPAAKYAFPMSYWEREDSLITVGGFDGSFMN